MEESPVRVDAHHHLWDPTRATYPWMVGEALDPVRRLFTPDDLAPELAAQRISGTVLVQTISSEDETRGFLELAARTAFVWGVIGWVDLNPARLGPSAPYVTRKSAFLREQLGNSRGRSGRVVGCRLVFADEN